MNCHKLLLDGFMQQTVLKSILVIGSDSNCRFLLQKILEKDRFKVIAAQSGLEGLRLAWENLPDGVVIDDFLLDIDELEFMAKLRTDEKAAHIPLIAIKQSKWECNAERLCKAGFAHCLNMPVDVKNFAQTIRRAISGATKE
jgi:two-component system cell cycle response regulator DivK